MLKIVPTGLLKDHFPKGYKSGLVVHTDRVSVAVSALDQFMNTRAVFSQYKWKVLAGTTRKNARELTESEIRNASIGRTDRLTNIYLVPGMEGHDPGTLTAIAVQVAFAVVSGLIQAMLAPKPQTGHDQSSSALYKGGLNTSVVGAPLAYLAGLKVFCGSQVIEGAIKSLQNAGGGSGYVGEQDGSPVGPGEPGDGTGEPGVDPRTGWVDTGTGWWQDVHRYEAGLAGEGGSRSARQLANQGNSYARLKALLAPGAGPTDGPYGSTIREKEQNIFLDRVPLRDPGTNRYNANGVQWTYRDGRPGQQIVGLVPGIPTPHDANDELTKANTAGVVKVVQNPQADFIETRVRCRLVDQDNKKGDQYPTAMSLRFEVKRASDTAWTVARTWSINKKNTEGFDTDILINAPAPTDDENEAWSFKVTRLTPDSTSDRLIADAQLMGWTEYEDRDLAYDGSDDGVPTALLGIQIDAANYGEGKFPDVAVIWSGKQVRVPINYDPVARTYDGIWNGQWKYAATENPVWLWLDMATDKEIGGGIDDSKFNPMRLLPIAKYCDERIEGKCRYSLNKQYTDERGLWEHLAEVAKTFRAIPYYDGNEYVLAAEMPDMPVHHYVHNDMVEEGLFDWDETEAESRYNWIEVEWDDPSKFYLKTTTIVKDDADIAKQRAKGVANNGVIKTRIEKEGCTTEFEARYWANQILWTGLNETKLVSFTSGLNSEKYIPGDRIYVTDWNRTGQPPVGRAKAVTSPDSFEIDADFTFEAMKSYKLLAVVDNSLVIKDIPMKTEEETTRTINVDDHGVSVGTPVGIVDPAGIQPWSGVVRSVENNGPGQYTVRCQQWREDKFAVFDGLPEAPPFNWEVQDFTVGKPGTPTASRYSAPDDNGQVRHMVELNWTPGSGTPMGYIVEVMEPDDTGYRRIIETTATFHSFPISGDWGEYRFTVKAINIRGESSEPSLLRVTFQPSGASLLKAPVYVGLE